MTSFLLSLLFTIPLLITWSYRGGSIPMQQSWGFLGKSRPLTLLATPFFICLSAWFVLPEMNTITWCLFGLGGLLFFGAQSPGWGSQMDLGRHWGVDDEWGYKIRDMIFGKERPLLDELGNQRKMNGKLMFIGNYKRDLFGLYMRMIWFVFPAIPWYFVDPWLSLISLSLLFSPMIWNYEYKKIILPFNAGQGKHPNELVPFKGVIGHCWVEFYIGLMLLIVMALVNTLIYFV